MHDLKVIKPLPDPFLANDGTRVATLEAWRARRLEIVEMVMNTEYGTMPATPEAVVADTIEREDLEGGIRRERVRITVTPMRERPDVTFRFDVTVWRPSEKAIARRRALIPGFDETGLPAVVYVGNSVFRSLLDNGVMMLCYENDQLEPMEMGNPIVGPARRAYETLEPGAYTWGSLSAWAWGAIRVLEYTLTLPDVDGNRVMVSGHSRNGKTALLAGALDERFALVNPAGSGCAGSGSYLALGEGCEDLAALTSRDRWWAWTHPAFESWVGREAELPFDQHFVMGLVAPRPLLRTDGTEDTWANPKGTCVTFLGTEPIYALYDATDRNGIHFHEGGHDHTEEDASALLAFADRLFYSVETGLDFKALVLDRDTLQRLWSDGIIEEMAP